MTIKVFRTDDAAFIYEIDYEEPYDNFWTVCVIRIKQNARKKFRVLALSLVDGTKRVKKVNVYNSMEDAQKEVDRLVFAYSV